MLLSSKVALAWHVSYLVVTCEVVCFGLTKSMPEICLPAEFQILIFYYMFQEKIY